MNVNVEELNNFQWSHATWELHDNIKKSAPNETIGYIANNEQLHEVVQAVEALHAHLKGYTFRPELGTEYLASLLNITTQEAEYYGVTDLVNVVGIAAPLVQNNKALFAFPYNTERIDHIEERSFVYLDLLDVEKKINDNRFGLKELTDIYMPFVIIVDRFFETGRPLEELEKCMRGLRTLHFSANVDLKFAYFNQKWTHTAVPFEFIEYAKSVTAKTFTRMYTPSQFFFTENPDYQFRTVNVPEMQPTLNKLYAKLDELVANQIITVMDNKLIRMFIYLFAKTPLQTFQSAYENTVGYARSIVESHLEGTNNSKQRMASLDKLFNEIKYANLVDMLQK